jgi:uncharacterized membrane protein YfcA
LNFHAWEWLLAALGALLVGVAKTGITGLSLLFMVVYPLAMRLPKMEYMVTGAVFLLMLNLFKAPFMVWLGLITPASLMLNAELAPAVIAGAFLGRWLLGRINQRLFENIAIALTLVAGARMCI